MSFFEQFARKELAEEIEGFCDTCGRTERVELTKFSENLLLWICEDCRRALNMTKGIFKR